MHLSGLRATGCLEIVEESIEQPDVCASGLSGMNYSLLGGVQEVEQVCVLANGELDFLFFGQKFVDVPITHFITILEG
jgi:hypothetical protein